MIKNPLLDLDFLKALDENNSREVYAEIFALNSDGEILESLEGYVTQGSINIDGKSAVRRTCSLTIVANELNIHEYYWGLHTKFKLSVGLKNNINPEYPDIIWFPQGEYVISSFATNQTLSNYTISIQGKDKMTLLNGNLGGIITSLTWDFGTVTVHNKDGWETKEKILIRDIIIGVVHQFANEPLRNIIINDLDDVGLELLEYRGDTPMYVVIDVQKDEPVNITLNGNTLYYDESGQIMFLKDIPTYNPLFYLERDNIDDANTPTVIYDSERNSYTVAKIEYGMTAGYRITDLVYAGDLIINIGQPVTSVLDKIVEMLGDFEYFYDIDGRFIFQRKKTYIDIPWNNIIREEDYIENKVYSSPIAYSFENGVQVTSYSNKPDLNKLRNDFSVWGTRKGVTGASIPIHMRFAIDTKPKLFVNYEGQGYTTFKSELDLIEYIQNINPANKLSNNEIIYNSEWREVLYQMAQDYNRHHLKEDYYVKLANNNYGLYTNGKTGYEQYYVDINGFWRDIYVPAGKVDEQFEKVYLAQTKYLDDYEKYYYGAPNYVQDINEPYHSNITYYTKQDFPERYIEVKGVSKADYNNNKSHYYWIDRKEPEIIKNCQIIEPYSASGSYYTYDENKKLYTLVNELTEQDYKGNEKNYYYIKGNNYTACSIVLPYSPSQTYYTHNGTEYINGKVSRALYEQNPANYWYQETYYEQCSNNSVHTENENYYQKIYNNNNGKYEYVTVRDLTREIFDNNPSLYYTKTKILIYLNCMKKLYAYDKNKTYFEKSGNTYIKIDDFEDANAYNKALEAGRKIYFGDLVYECCVHPVSFTAGYTFYQVKENQYDESGWINSVFTNPDLLNFWFDFIDENSELSKYGGHTIGNRPIGVNDNQITGIYFRETPTVIFSYPEDIDREKKLGYTYLQLSPGMENLFSISSQGKTAKSVIDKCVYDYVCDINTITLSVFPIYHLEPNVRIFVRNDESGINGEYILTRYNLNLDGKSNMTINAAKAVEKLY